MSALLERIWERPPARWALLFLVAFGLLLSFDYGDAIKWLFGAPKTDGATLANPLAAGALAGLFTATVFAVSKVPNFRIQVLIAWVLLLALFLLFFYAFDLKYEFIWERLRFLLGFGIHDGFVMGAVLTLFICAVSIIASTLIALAAALGRLSSNGIAFGISTFYTSFFRGTPLLLQILLVYLGLPQIGIILTPVPSAIIALSLCYGAYSAEIIRAGIIAVPVGQREAARALGVGELRIMQKIVLPQAMRLIVPPLGNQFIAMLKDSSLVSVLGAWELMYMAQTHGRSEFRYIEMLITAALIYWALSIVFEYFQARLERHYGKGITNIPGKV